MTKINELLQEIGISKVKLAKYLGVSRQMVYNYLEIDDLNKWPKEKKVLIFKLLNIENGNEDNLDSVVINAEYLNGIEERLNQGIKKPIEFSECFDMTNLTKEQKSLLGDIVYFIKEKLSEEGKEEEHFYAFTYLLHLIQAIDNVPEIRYILGYVSKATGFTKGDDFKFNEEQQFIFEGILYTAMTLYNNGGTSKSKLVDSHNKFVKEIEAKNEEKLSRTQQLNTVKIQALQELGYTEINETNAAEVFEKIAEIQSRRA